MKNQQTHGICSSQSDSSIRVGKPSASSNDEAGEKFSGVNIARPNNIGDRLTTWTFVYVVNLLIPAIFALLASTPQAIWGVFLSVVVVWVIGCYLLMKLPWHIGCCLNAGGLLMILLQCLPIPHITAGALAVQIWRSCKAVVLGVQPQTLAPKDWPWGSEEVLENWLDGFAVALLFGVILMGFTFLIGMAVESLERWLSRRKEMQYKIAAERIHRIR